MFAELVQLIATEIGLVKAPPPMLAEQLIELEELPEPDDDDDPVVGVVSGALGTAGFGGLKGIIGPGKGPIDFVPDVVDEAVLLPLVFPLGVDELLAEFRNPAMGSDPLEEGPGAEPA